MDWRITMKFFKEFKAFAMRGNVIDMAVGVVIGAAFSAIVNALVTNIITPLIGILTGGVDISALSVTVGSAKLEYGIFLNAILQFIIIAFCLFLVVKAINKMKKPAPAPAPKRLCPYCKQVVADDATRCPHCTSNLE